MAETNTTAKSTAKKTTTTATNAGSAKEKELENKVSALMAQVEMLTKLLSAQQSNNASAQQAAPVTAVPAVSGNADVALVYMSDSLGVIRYGNGIELNCTRFGEEFVITRSAFDEIVGRYRKWFDQGILAVSSKNVDVAAAKGIKTDAEYSLSAAELERLGKMSVEEIEKLWENTKIEAHRMSIVTYFKRKFIENKDPGYRDRSRIDCLNRLTNNGFVQESRELSGDYYIRPTVM